MHGGRRRKGEVSLERALSKLGAASRAEARRLVEAGEVEVDGERVTDPSRAVRPELAEIRVRGERFRRSAFRLILFHRRRPDLSVDAWRTFWHGEHAERLSRLPGVLRYTQHPPDCRDGDPGLDGVDDVYIFL